MMPLLKNYFLPFAKARKDIVFLSFILIISVWMGLPFFSLMLAHGHDSSPQLMKTISVYQAWRDGDLLCRWSPHLVSGYGYPILNFYAPLFFYLAAALMFVLPVLLAYNIAIFLCLFFSGVAMYFFARELWGRSGGFLSAVAYLMLPYHILDVFVRSSVGEIIAFVFFPLVLLFVLRLSRNFNTKNFVLAAFSSGALFLSHNIAVLMLFPVAAAYTVYLFVLSDDRNIRRSILAFTALLSGFCLSAYFILPAMFEKQFVNIGKLLTGYMDYHQHFVYWWQLFYARWGFGASVAGSEDGISYMIGGAHLFLAGIVIIFIKRVTLSVKDALKHIVFFTILFLAYVFLTLGVSAFLWDVVPLLPFVQLPWRFLLGAGTALCVMAGAAVHLFNKEMRVVAALVACGAILCLNLQYCYVNTHEKIEIASVSEFLKNGTPMDSMEFLPKWVKRVSIAAPAEKLQVWQGNAVVVDLGGKPLDRLFDLKATTPSMMIFHSYYFPGWEVFVDGRPTQIMPDNPFGLIVFLVQPGDHAIRVHFGTTPIRQFAEGLSLLTLLGLALLLIFRRKVDVIMNCSAR
jgi:hypothetical protein